MSDRRRHVGLTEAQHRDIHGWGVLECECCHDWAREQMDAGATPAADRPEPPLTEYGGDA